MTMHEPFLLPVCQARRQSPGDLSLGWGCVDLSQKLMKTMDTPPTTSLKKSYLHTVSRATQWGCEPLRILSQTSR